MKMDIFIVACAKDIKLLRHFFSSYRLFFRSEGKIHLLLWKKDQPLLKQIDCPDNLILHWKDEVTELVKDDFRNQMYLKLISDRYAQTDWYWLVDADYLVTAPLQSEDFLSGDRPCWFYRPWNAQAEKSWRTGTEALLGESIPFQFMDAPQYLFRRDILQDMRRHHDVSRILSSSPMASEFVAYGAFAWQHHRDAYAWHDLDRNGAQPIACKLNQRPPTYNVLRDDASLADTSDAKYVIFWSHWDMAEEKMREFLIDAQKREFGEVRAEPQTAIIPLPVTPQELETSGLAAADGHYSDGWMKKLCAFYFTSAANGTMEMLLECHFPAKLSLTVNGTRRLINLNAGVNTIEIPMIKDTHYDISLAFSEGKKESSEGRMLYALSKGIRFANG